MFLQVVDKPRQGTVAHEVYVGVPVQQSLPSFAIDDSIAEPLSVLPLLYLVRPRQHGYSQGCEDKHTAHSEGIVDEVVDGSQCSHRLAESHFSEQTALLGVLYERSHPPLVLSGVIYFHVPTP